MGCDARGCDDMRLVDLEFCRLHTLMEHNSKVVPEMAPKRRPDTTQAALNAEASRTKAVKESGLIDKAIPFDWRT